MSEMYEKPKVYYCIFWISRDDIDKINHIQNNSIADALLCCAPP